MTYMTMKERIARAMERPKYPQWTDAQFEIWWNKDPFFVDQKTSWGHFTGTRKGYCLWQAEAVLDAMREPTEGMRKAGDLPGWDGDVTIDLSYEVWQAMIDAAKTEGQSE